MTCVQHLNREQLLAEIAKRDEDNARLHRENARLEQLLRLMEQKVDGLVRRLFGTSSEKLDPAQLQLLLLELPGIAEGKAGASSLQEADPPRAAVEPRRPRRERWPQDLPVVEEVLEPAEVQADPEQYRLIGAEVSEQLDYEPARFLLRRLIRRKYVRRQQRDQPPVIAPLPETLQERCIAAPGLLAAVIVGKYVDHLPLYRQEDIFRRRHQVHLPRASLARWMGLAADWLAPVYNSIRTEVMAGGYVQVDETPIRYLDPGGGKTKLGYLWTAHAPGGDTFYHWETSRAAACLSNVLSADFRGKVQCDGYAAYPSFARNKQHLELVGCWAHARRRFYEARPHVPLRATWILRQIGHLYQIEKQLRQAGAGPELRAAQRASQAAPILARLHRVLNAWKASGAHLPASSMGQAIDYALGQWDLLGRYLHDGRLEIDNNQVENAIRPTAVGKKNWLFIGHAECGQRGAILFTIVQACRQRGINPFDYLKDVLTQIPHHTNKTVAQLTPENWLKNRQPHAARAA
jgi:transposase